jgi:hypothetical protein
MNPENRKTRRLAGVFFLGWMLLNYPILSLWNHSTTLGGIPLLYGFVFGAWTLIICLAGFITRSGRPPHGRDD